MNRYYWKVYDEQSLTVMEVGGCIEGKTIVDRVVCDVPLYGRPDLDAVAKEDADHIVEALNRCFGSVPIR